MEDRYKMEGAAACSTPRKILQTDKSLLIYLLVRSDTSLQQLHHGGRLDGSTLGSASFAQKLTQLGFAQDLIRSTDVDQHVVERIYLDGSINRLYSLDHLLLESLGCFSRVAVTKQDVRNAKWVR
jgi:hypothetical protein